MLKGKHYVPIPRCKLAEWQAVSRLEPQDRAQILPLFELLPKDFQPPRKGPRVGMTPQPDAVFARVAENILSYWGYEHFYLDLQHLRGLPRVQGMNLVAFAAKQLGLVRAKPIMVCRLTDDHETQSALRALGSDDQRGVCLRVLPTQVLEQGFSRRVIDFLKKIGLNLNAADFLLDYQNISSESPDFAALFALVPELRGWRRLIVASGAFPENLVDYSPPDRYEIPRRDWTAWRDQVLDDSLARIPLFSDYTIQFGLYKEPIEDSNPSASIRYTFGDVWVVMRGSGLRNKNGPKNEQYPAEAQLICESDEFCGAKFSDGDAYIYEKFSGIGGNGTPQTWLRAGINHHLTYVVRQLAAGDIRTVPPYRGDRPIESIRPAIRV